MIAVISWIILLGIPILGLFEWLKQRKSKPRKFFIPDGGPYDYEHANGIFNFSGWNILVTIFWCIAGAAAVIFILHVTGN